MILSHIAIRNLLSFGAEGVSLSLRPLNVLVGPNGSGKSNLIEVISLLRAMCVPSMPESKGDLQGVVRRGGGPSEWIWKGRGKLLPAIIVSASDAFTSFQHNISFIDMQTTMPIRSEGMTIRTQEKAEKSYHMDFPYFVLAGADNMATVLIERVDPRQSVLSQIRGSSAQELNLLTGFYSGFRLYREWQFGRSSIFRSPQPADMPTDVLEEDFSNLGLFLNNLRSNPVAKRSVLDHLRDLYSGLEDFDVRVKGGTVQVFLTEGDFTIPASRLSDGTLRYLCLLAILCDPEPPPLICIEEPELGLHPDLLPKIADLLVEASERTQLIVTTHSDILIDALSEQPESVVVFEKHEGQTQAKRLDKDELKVWLEKYKLGQLWTSGHIGGTRW